MAGAVITVTTGVGGLAAAVATVELYWSFRGNHALDPAAMVLLVVGVVLLMIGFMWTFDCRSRLWAHQVEAQWQARQRHLQSLGITPHRPPRER